MEKNHPNVQKRITSNLNTQTNLQKISPQSKNHPPIFSKKRKKDHPPRIPWVFFFRHSFFLVVPFKNLRFGNVRTRVLRLLVMSQLLAPLGGHPGGSIGNQPRVGTRVVFSGFVLGDPKIGRFGGKKRLLTKKNGDSLELSWVGFIERRFCQKLKVITQPLVFGGDRAVLPSYECPFFWWWFWNTLKGALKGWMDLTTCFFLWFVDTGDVDSLPEAWSSFHCGMSQWGNKLS